MHNLIRNPFLGAALAGLALIVPATALAQRVKCEPRAKRLPSQGAALAFQFAAEPGKTAAQFDPYWKKVYSYQVTAALAPEYVRLAEKIRGFAVNGQSLVPLPGYSLYQNQDSLLLTQGNEGTAQISHARVTSIPGLGERIKWLFKSGSVLAFYCTCSSTDEGDCKIMELNCTSAGCSDCGSYWVYGSPGTPPIIIDDQR